MKRIFAIAFCMAVGTTQAQSLDFAQLIPSPYLQNNVNFSLGAVTLATPKYVGASEYRLAAYPVFDAQWKNGVFFSAFSGFGYNFSKNPGLQYGVRMTIESGRDETRSNKIRGLGDINSAIEPGAFLNYFIDNKYTLLSSIRYGSGADHNGIQLSVGARATQQLNAQHRLSAVISTNWANSNYMQSYFGVNKAQALASGYDFYTPGAGFSELKLGASWHWNIDTNWSLTTGASIKRILGDAANSPFVAQKNPISAFSTANYRF